MSFFFPLGQKDATWVPIDRLNLLFSERKNLIVSNCFAFYLNIQPHAGNLKRKKLLLLLLLFILFYFIFFVLKFPLDI